MMSNDRRRCVDCLSASIAYQLQRKMYLYIIYYSTDQFRGKQSLETYRSSDIFRDSDFKAN